jgi:hypothetical protein
MPKGVVRLGKKTKDGKIVPATMSDASSAAE